MNLLLIEKKLLDNSIKTLCKKKNCEIIIIKKNLKDILNKKKSRYKKIILISEKILVRSSETYLDIKNYLKQKRVFFLEIGYKKSKITTDKAISDSLINGSSIGTKKILEKVIN